KNFNAQYPTVNVKTTNSFHDRFLVLDDKTVYHIGASIKDAGKKCFGITLIQDNTMANELINRLNKIK
nr:ORF6N domain-containing protein [Pseudobutyrivibrio sp.]